MNRPLRSGAYCNNIMHGFRASEEKSSEHFQDFHKLKLLTNFDVNMTTPPGGVMN